MVGATCVLQPKNVALVPAVPAAGTSDTWGGKPRTAVALPRSGV